MVIEKSFFLCAVQRSGSNLLCDALADTGLAGRPREHFLWLRPSHPKHQEILEQNLLENPRDFVDWVKAQATSSNGVFGTKIMGDYIKNALALMHSIPEYKQVTPANILQDVFPNLKFIQLQRRDKLKQAISQVKAAQTKSHSIFVGDSTQPSAFQPTYDPGFIATRLQFIYNSEKTWRQFFKAIDVQPLKLFYEDLAADLGGSVRTVLEYLDINGSDRISPPTPRRKKQADSINVLWEKAYLDLHSGIVL